MAAALTALASTALITAAHQRSPYGQSRAHAEIAALSSDASALAQTIDDRIEHGPAPRVPRINWIYAAIVRMGMAPDASQDPNVTLHRGQGLCHNAASVAVTVARSNGWSASMVDIGEHVLAEVHVGDGPWVVDADFGVAQRGRVSDLAYAPHAELGPVEGTVQGAVEGPVQGPVQGDRADSHHGNQARGHWLAAMRSRGVSARSTEIVAKALDHPNTHRRVEGVSLSPRLYALETCGYWLSLLLPAVVGLVLAGTIISRARRWIRTP